MKLCNILLLASILPVGESRGSGNSYKRKANNSYAQITTQPSSSSFTPSTLISTQPTHQQPSIDFIRPESPVNSIPTRTNAPQSSEKPYLFEGDQQTVYRKLGDHISAFLAANDLLENKTITTKHGYTFKVNTDPKNIYFDNNTTGERFKAVATQWQNKVLAVYNWAIKTKNYSLATEAQSTLEKIIYLEDKEWKKAPEIELPLIKTAQALAKYVQTPFYGKLTVEFVGKEQVSQQAVDDYANNLELPTGEVIDDYERNKFLSIMLAQKETVLPDDVAKLAKHNLKLEQVLKSLPAVKHDRESVCSGCGFFENETQNTIPLHDNMETTPENKRLEVQTRAAIAKLADPKVFNIKEENITAIDKNLEVCGKKIYDLEQKIAKKRAELVTLLRKNSQTSFEKKETLTPLQEASLISCPRTPSDVEKIHQEIAILENSVKDLKIDLNTLCSSKEWATEARALQKAVLLQLASNADMTLDEVPTITTIQKSRFNPFGVSLPAKTTETPSALFTRIAHEETKKKHSDQGSRAYLAMYRRLTSAHEAARWTEEQKQLQQAERTLDELEVEQYKNNPASSSQTDTNA